MILWPSVHITKDVCSRWLMSRTGQKPFIPAVMDDPPECYEVTDVLLIGRLYNEIIHCERWQGEKFRLWSLGSVAKECRCHFSAIPRTKMGYVNRYEIFPLKESLPLRKKSEEWTLVYSGRIKADKGIGLFLKIASALQMSFNENVKPVIYGILEKEKSAEANKEARDIQDLMATLQWNTQPEFHIGLNSSEWIERPLENPVLFCFSVFQNDDFGIAVAQAQAKGWPVLLSAWGGHHDCVGESCFKFKIPRQRVMDLSQSPVQDICEEILHSFASGPARNTATHSSSDPEVVSKEELFRFRERLLTKGITAKGPWPPEVLLETFQIFSERQI